MKRLFILLTAALMSIGMMAAEYVGTMQVEGGYTQKNVRVTMDTQGNLTLYNVKFALLMPVRVDVRIPGIKQKADRISCVLTTPYVDDKPQPKRYVSELRGTITPFNFSFSCLMGGKRIHYSGQVPHKGQ